MKTNQSLIGGRLIDEPRIYAAYARYFVEFVRAYEQARVPVYAVTVQNEPQNRHPNGYPGTDLPGAHEAKLIEARGPALRAAGLHTKILGYDHNSSEHPDDIASTPPGEDPETEYPTDLLNSSAGRWIAGTAFHCYSGDPSRQTALHDAFPDKGIWFTECSGSHGPSDPPAQVFSDTLKWHARNLVLGVTRNWGRTVVNWNLALDPAGGPHLGGCDTCSGVVTVGPGQTVTENAEYYTLGHLARFVRPGAVRIASTSFGTTGWNGQIMDAAFRNPDGSTALVVHNENDDPRSFAVAQGGASFAYTLPGGALATFTWPASPAVNDGRVLLDAHGTTATASPPGDAGNAVDDDATTRWTTGAGQEPGQYLQVDLGRSQPVRRVVLDTGADAGDFPRGYALFTSADGMHWSDAPARPTRIRAARVRAGRRPPLPNDAGGEGRSDDADRALPGLRRRHPDHHLAPGRPAVGRRLNADPEHAAGLGRHGRPLPERGAGHAAAHPAPLRHRHGARGREHLRRDGVPAQHRPRRYPGPGPRQRGRARVEQVERPHHHHRRHLSSSSSRPRPKPGGNGDAAGSSYCEPPKAAR